MSDCARNRFNEKEDFQVVLGKGNPGESSCQQHTKWMAHWARASSNAYGKSSSPLEDANDSTYYTEDSETSLFELKKSSVTERLMLGGNHEGIFMEKLNSNMWGVSHDVRQEAEQKKNERRDGSFQSSVVQMHKDDNFYAKRVVSETLSVCRFSDLPLDFQKLVNTDENPDSHWNQLPMLSFNQKVDSIINPRRRSATGTVFDDLFVPQQIPKLDVGSSNLMTCSHQECELQFPRMTDMVMDHFKPSGDIMYLLEDPTCLISDHAGEKLRVGNNSFGHEDLNTHRMEYAANVTDSCMLPDPAANILGINSEGGAVTRERQPMDKFTDSVKENGACLFEMLTIPSKPQSTYPIDSLSSYSHLFGAQNQFSHKTRAMHGDAQYVSKSSAGIDSLVMQKDIGCAERANEQQATEIMDLDPPLFQSRMINQVLNDAIRPSAGADPSDKWLRRLLHDATDPHVYHRSKRPKTGYCGPVGVSDTDIVDHVEARCVRCWLGRLCRGGVAPVSHGEPAQGTGAAAEPDVAARELGGHFPSIKAMAMMGRVMSKVRPFDRQRKGPCVMWKADEGA